MVDGACNPIAPVGAGVRLGPDSELVTPVLITGVRPEKCVVEKTGVLPVFIPGLRPEAGVVEEMGVFPVLTTGGVPEAGVVEEMGVFPVLTAGGGPATGVVEALSVTSVLTTGVGPVAGTATGPGVSPLPVRSAAVTASASVPGLRAISPIHCGSSHGRLCGASPTRFQGEFATREAVHEPYIT